MHQVVWLLPVITTVTTAVLSFFLKPLEPLAKMFLGEPEDTQEMFQLRRIFNAEKDELYKAERDLYLLQHAELPYYLETQRLSQADYAQARSLVENHFGKDKLIEQNGSHFIDATEMKQKANSDCIKLFPYWFDWATAQIQDSIGTCIDETIKHFTKLKCQPHTYANITSQTASTICTLDTDWNPGTLKTELLNEFNSLINPQNTIGGTTP